MLTSSRWLLLVVSFSLSLSAAAEEFYGPLRNRDMGPVSFPRLHMLPDHALSPSNGRLAFELHLSSSNTFAMDEETYNYLEQRGGRGELTQQDVDNILALRGDTYLFDGSLDLLQFTTHYGLSNNWSVYFSLPMMRLGGGFMDGTIESFHDTFGFSTFGRDFLPRNQVNAVVSLGDQEIVFLDVPPISGVGDPIFGIRYYWRIDSANAFSFELAHKEVVQDPKFFRTTGASDTGIQLNWHHFAGDSAFYVNASAVKLGSADPFPGNTRNIMPKLNFAWEYRLQEKLNLLLQFNAQRSLFRNGTDPEISSDVYQASIGLRQRRGEFVWSYALTENLVNFNNTADIGIHLGFAWIPVPAD